MRRLSAQVDRLMEEARRRFESFAVRDNTPLEKAWVGLGMPSYYRAGVEAGLMVEIQGNYRPRILHWYRLTPEGVALYREMFPGSEDGSARKYRDGLPIEEK